MKQLAFILIPCSILLLGGCVDSQMARAGQEQEMARLSSQNRELKIAVDVVLGQLREVDEPEEFDQLAALSPQIYQLATALLPGGSAPQQTASPVQPVTASIPPRANSHRVHQAVQSNPHTNAALNTPVPAPQAGQFENPASIPDQPSQPFAGASLLPVSTNGTGHATKEGAYDAPPVMTNSRSLFAAVQIGAYRSNERAKAGWQEILQTSGAVLGDLRPRTEQVDLGDRGVFYRLKAGPIGSLQEADQLCLALQARGVSCLRTDFTGQDQS